MKLYISDGYNKKDIPELILKNNLYGLDIDDRAGQFAIISVMLKAREYDSEIFNKIDFNSLNILSIPESNPELRQYANDIKDKEVREIADYLINTFENGKEIGSLLIVEEKDYDKVTKYFEEATPNIFNRLLWEGLKDIIIVAKILSKKYDVVVTNPPYLNNYVMPNDLKQYLNENFSAGSKDLFSAFMCRNIMLTNVNKYCAYMTPNVWMFIVSYLDMRLKLIKDIHFESLVLMAKGSFFKEATVDITAFVIKNEINNHKGVYINLEPYKGDMAIQENALIKELESEISNNKYVVDQKEFKSIPNSVFRFWLSENLLNDFKFSRELKGLAEHKEGLSTSDNKKFLRIWREVSIFDEQLNSDSFEKAKSSKAKHFPFNKSGDYRKWYRNNDYVINYENDGAELLKTKKAAVRNQKYYFCESITWSLISSGNVAFRYKPFGHIFDAAGSSIFGDLNCLLVLLGFVNSNVAMLLLKVIAPTLNYAPGSIGILPIMDINNEKQNDILKIVNTNINLSKLDWDSFETSWDFKKHPLI